MTELDVVCYDHSGVVIDSGNMAVTMMMPVELDADAIIKAAAAEHSMTVVAIYKVPSRTPNNQRVRVVFAATDEPGLKLGKGFAVTWGGRLAHVRVFYAQHRKTADTVSVASSGKPADDVSMRDLLSLSRELLQQTEAEELRKQISTNQQREAGVAALPPTPALAHPPASEPAPQPEMTPPPGPPPPQWSQRPAHWQHHPYGQQHEHNTWAPQQQPADQ
eukprot:gene6450-4586_t